ncbi:MAG TPA: FHA domain-containing protein [Pirellulales bacterium]|nr:FHA domain-containing protein [Pirellulales bacterium]
MRCTLHIRTGKHAGREIPIRGPRFLIGCADDCHLKLNAGQGRPYHCALLIEDDGLWVRDYGGGTVVSGVRIVDRQRLNHADRLEFGPLHFELSIQDAPLPRDDRVPEEKKAADPLPKPVEPVEGRVAPVHEPSGLDYGSVIVTGWTTTTEANSTNARSELPDVLAELFTSPSKQPEPAATAELSDPSHTRPSHARSESSSGPPQPLTASKQPQPAATAELSDLSDARPGHARPESPNGPPRPVAAPFTPAEPADSPRVVRPWYHSPPPKEAEPAPEVASSLLRRFFVRKNLFNDPNPAPAAAPKSAGTPWWLSILLKLFPADGLDPNVMFVLGIFVGIGLSAAGLAFFSISGR